MIFREDRKKAAFTFAEYAIIIGVVIMAVLVMRTYVSRGIRANVKAITKNFLGQNQTELIKSEAYDIKTTTKASLEDIEGGAQNRTVEEKKEGNLSIEEEGKAPFFAPDFIGWKEGAVNAPDHPREKK